MDVVSEVSKSEELEESITEDGAKRPSRIWATLREIAETVLLTLVIFFAIRLAIQNFRIDGQSMEPSFHSSQYLIVNKLEYRFHPPERGDVIVFRYPRDPSRDFIKRIIALPGETVRIDRGQVYIDEQALEESYLSDLGAYSWGPALVRPGEFFVLGDNRSNSSDSHAWGMLPRENIIGKAWLCYWPPGYLGIVEHSELR